MPGTYVFATDRARSLLTIRFSGFFRAADLIDYEADKGRALLSLGLPRNEHHTLCDFSQCGAQSADVLELFARSLADPTNASRRLAVVISAALARLQVNRIVTRAGASCFFSLDEAAHWLAESDGALGPEPTAPVS